MLGGVIQRPFQKKKILDPPLKDHPVQKFKLKVNQHLHLLDRIMNHTVFT